MMRRDDEMQPGREPQTFDAAAHLKDEETIRAYLQAALDDPTSGALWLALDTVAKARQQNARD
ncbi:DNA-binding protein [Pseudomonas paraeruginosa]|uniref:helix-turn-helix domain-containing transcriptional regulator n=1 Tax=Pseudomonas paraeruginosa TaxID=2994495 RepID=UPI0039FCDAEA